MVERIAILPKWLQVNLQRILNGLIIVTILYSCFLSVRYLPEHTLLLSNDMLLDGVSHTWGDNQAYMGLVQDYGYTPPFHYRLIPLSLVMLLSQVIPMFEAFVLANALTTWLSAMLMIEIAKRFFCMRNTDALLMGILLITCAVGVSRTMLLPMLDTSALFASVAIVYAILHGNPYIFVIVAALATGTKEVFAVTGITYALYNRDHSLHVRVFVAMLPILMFSGWRFVLGGGFLEVNYGYDLSTGELPSYGERLLSAWGIHYLLLQTFLSVFALWLGIVMCIKNRFLLIAFATYVIPIVGASWFLSSRISRPLVVIAPIMVIGFMLLLQYINDR